MSTASPTTSAPRLPRSLSEHDAVLLGLGAMIGAGIFGAVAPAAASAGEGVLLALLLAALVAWLNALSVSQLAACHPESGGAYLYGRERLSAHFGFLAGAAFVAGKLASCTAMAQTFAAYVAPDHARPVGAAVALALAIVNARGVEKTLSLTKLLLVLVLVSLALFIVAALSGSVLTWERLAPRTLELGSIAQGAGFLFFAFAGYARIATLGEEVKEPARAIPRAIARAFGVTLLLYAATMAVCLLVLPASALGHATAPLAAVLEAGTFAAAAPIVRVGAAVASLGVLLSLLAGLGRTTLAMAREGDLPRPLAAVHRRFGVPHRAELAAGLLVAVAVLLTDLHEAIAFSSFCVLVYYGIANASAVRLRDDERRLPRWLAIAGGVGCAAIAFSLPLFSVLAGLGVLSGGWTVRAIVRSFGGRTA